MQRMYKETTKRYETDGIAKVNFCTHEGSGMGHSESDIKEICLGAEVNKGLAIHGGSVKNSRNTIVSWIEK